MMLPKRNTEAPVLPQEIADIIIDEVAALNSPETLRACALISKSFCFPSRRRLFSDISLVLDKWGQTRARRLIKVLENPDNTGLTAHVRSLTIILDASSVLIPARILGSRMLGRQSQKFKHMGWSIVEKLGLWETSLDKLLNLLMASQLTNFALDADGRMTDYGGMVDWTLSLKGEITMGVFSSLLTHPSLKSLRISKFCKLDESFVAEALRSNLQELAFINVSLQESYKVTTNSNHIRTTNSSLQRLDIRRISHHGLRTTGIPVLPESLRYPFVTFTRLRSLVISSESEAVGEFILRVAHTLETLEIENVYWKSRINLDRLTSLRNLKMISTPYASGTYLRRSQSAICHLLSSAISPTGIQCIDLRFNVQMISRTSFPDIPTWTELDNLLSGRAFVNLSRLGLLFHFIHAASKVWIAGSGNEGYEREAGLLPQVASNPSVELHLEMRAIYAPLYMDRYTKYS